MRALFLILAVALTPLTATAQGQGTTEQTAPPTGERFTIALPDTWIEATRSNHNGTQVIAYVPPRQTAAAWTDMLSLQIYEGMTTLPAQALYERSLSTVRDSCENSQAGELQTGLSNDYPAAFWVLGCGQNQHTGQGETSFFRLVQGPSALYMAQRTWRTKPYLNGTDPEISPAARQDAIELLSSFIVCEPGNPKHPCPTQAPLPGQ